MYSFTCHGTIHSCLLHLPVGPSGVSKPVVLTRRALNYFIFKFRNQVGQSENRHHLVLLKVRRCYALELLAHSIFCCLLSREKERTQSRKTTSGSLFEETTCPRETFATNAKRSFPETNLKPLCVVCLCVCSSLCLSLPSLPMTLFPFDDQRRCVKCRCCQPRRFFCLASRSARNARCGDTGAKKTKKVSHLAQDGFPPLTPSRGETLRPSVPLQVGIGDLFCSCHGNCYGMSLSERCARLVCGVGGRSTEVAFRGYPKWCPLS